MGFALSSKVSNSDMGKSPGGGSMLLLCSGLFVALLIEVVVLVLDLSLFALVLKVELSC